MSAAAETETEAKDSPFDVEKYRDPHDTKAVWRLKQRFLLAHHSLFDEPQLVCLMNCYVNTMVYKCRYPQSVMSWLDSLTKDAEFVEDQQHAADCKKVSLRRRNMVKFVPASSDADGKDEGEGEGPQGGAAARGVKGARRSSRKRSSRSKSQEEEDEDWTCEEKDKATPVGKPAKTRGRSASQGKGAKGDAKPEGGKAPTPAKVAARAKSKGSDTPPKDIPKRVVERGKAMNPQEEKFYALAAQLDEIVPTQKNAVVAFHLAADKCHVTVNPVFEHTAGNAFSCVLHVDFATAARGEGPSKREAKRAAYELALATLAKPHLRMVRLNPEKPPELQGSDAAFTSAVMSPPTSPEMVATGGGGGGHRPAAFSTDITKLGQATQSNIHALAKVKPSQRKRTMAVAAGQKAPGEFIIIEHLSPQSNATSTLSQSAAFNKSLLEHEFVDEVVGGTARTRCRVSLDQNLLADVAGTSKPDAKAAAFQKALSKLSESCWTIQTKRAEDTDLGQISREALLGDIQASFAGGGGGGAGGGGDGSGSSANHAIPESNLGSKLLKKLGWSGGGIGAAGREGISEPVTVGGVINREGLGLAASQGLGRDFIPKVKDLLHQYAASDNQQDLAFSATFSKEERAIIHREGQKLGLKSHSHGSKDDRYLVISRKRNATQLLQHIMQSGGETSKYLLKPPSSERM